MENTKTVLLAASTLLTGIVPLAAFGSGHSYHELTAGIATLVFLFGSQELNRAVLQESVTKTGKAYRDFIETLGLFSVITAGLISTIVPTELALAVIGTVGVTIIFRMELTKSFRQSFVFRLGEKYWIGVVAAVYLATYSNHYFLFYGYILLIAVIAYDLSGLFLELGQRNRV